MKRLMVDRILPGSGTFKICHAEHPVDDQEYIMNPFLMLILSAANLALTH